MVPFSVAVIFTFIVSEATSISSPILTVVVPTLTLESVLVVPNPVSVHWTFIFTLSRELVPVFSILIMTSFSLEVVGNLTQLNPLSNEFDSATSTIKISSSLICVISALTEVVKTITADIVYSILIINRDAFEKLTHLV